MIHRINSLAELTRLVLEQPPDAPRDLLVRVTPELEREARFCDVDLNQFCSPVVGLDGRWRAGDRQGAWCVEQVHAVAPAHLVHHYILLCGEILREPREDELRDLMDGRRALLLVEGDGFTDWVVLPFDECEAAVSQLVRRRVQIPGAAQVEVS